MCKENNCKIKPFYNIEGEAKALYCFQHKLENMVDIKSKKCIYDNCKVQPIYNVEGETKGVYCSTHKLDGMVDIKHKTCIYTGCKTRPSYNIKGETKGLFCYKHKLDGMANVVHNFCSYEGCNIRPSYNIKGKINTAYCVKHKSEEMVDIVSNKCIYENCKVQPIYNVEGETKGVYCSTHKLNGMVDIKNKKCIYEGCKTMPIYNFEGKPNRLYCVAHKLEGMINVKHKTCKNEWCYTRNQEKYDGYCLFCYVNMFPDKQVTRNYKTKEYTVVEFVKSIFANFDWKTDKKIDGGCSKRRPDLLLDLGYQIIIIEIDENQHINYDCSCENKRIMELSQDLGHRPIVFIRFNPDDYINNHNEKIDSCWKLNKTGMIQIQKNKLTEWNDRLSNLKNQIEYWSKEDNKISKTIEIIQLYFDENIYTIENLK